MSKKINIFLIPLFIYSIYCSLQLGFTWDVLFHYELGKDRLDYLFSFGSNELDEKITVRKFYTGAYSTISAFFVQFLPQKYNLEAIYFVNLIFSTLAIFGIYKVTKEFFNKQIGKITFIFCFFNPIFFGHMSINSTDTIIAFANIWCFYKVIKYLKYQQESKKKSKCVLLLGLIIGLGLGVRYTFIITLLPIFLFIILEIFYFKIYINNNFSKKIFLIDLLIVQVIAYLTMVLFWPHTHVNIFLEPFKLAIESLSFGFGAPLILFNGETYLTTEIPKNYIFVNLFYKLPEFIIFGLITFFILFKKIQFFFKDKIKGFNFKMLILVTIVLFPNALLWANPYGVYDGFRLFIYLLPFISIIPAVLLCYLLKNIMAKLNKFVLTTLIILQVFFLFNFISITPYHYVYLNIFAGSYSEHSQKFENDYWGVSTKELIKSINNNTKIFSSEKVKIATCGVEKNAQKTYLRKIKKIRFKVVDVNEEFDYIIMNNRVIWENNPDKSNIKRRQTCFQKYIGEDLIKVEKRGLVLSKITKI